MFYTILVPLDGSPLAQHALRPAIAIAKRARATLRLGRVRSRGFRAPAPDDALFRVLAVQADADLGEVAAGLRLDGLSVDTKVVLNQPPAVAVLVAAEWAGLIVMASHGRGRVARVFLGSVTDKVVRG